MQLIKNNINELASLIHTENRAKGFWDKERNRGEILMLIVSELAEALEADRKNLKDSHLPHREGFEVELADALIRILDAAGGYGLDLGGALIEKLEYNRSRPKLHGKNY